MSVFTLDIERLVKRLQEESKELKAIASIQYPLYSVHCEILDSSPDPLDNLDKSIAKVINQISSSENDISIILGVPLSAVKARLEYFGIHEYLNHDGTRLTELGKNELFFMGEKKLKRKSYDFLIDGVTLEPVPSEFYKKRYRHVIIEEFEYSFFTRDDGKTYPIYDFAPSIVHTPMNNEIVQEKLTSIDASIRKNYKIPIGLESIENISFEKCTFPVLVALVDHPDGFGKELLDGFKVDGISDHLDIFEDSLRTRIDTLELRLKIKKDSTSSEFNDFEFYTNWNEIDIVSDEKKLFWISKEDLLTAFEQYYKLKNLSLENIISEPNEIGLSVTKELLKNAERRRLIINNINRGRDYDMTMKYKRTGVWVTFFTFESQDEFVLHCLEVIEMLEAQKNLNSALSPLIQKLGEYENYREILLFLEEFDLLEKIDMELYMIKKT